MTPLVFAALPMLVERSPTVCSSTRKKGNAFSRTGPVQGQGSFVQIPV